MAKRGEVAPNAKPERKARVFKLRTDDGLTLAAIAVKEGISVSRVRQLIASHKRRLRLGRA